MKNYYVAFIVLLFGAGVTAQPLTGIRTIKTAGGDYATFTAAFTDLNTRGTGAGGVVFNVDAGFTSIEDPIAITATGTAANPVVFQKSGAGANPVIRSTGTAATTDFTVKIAGGDYFTFDGIDITINTGSAMEYGYVLEGASTNGCQYNTIKNCSVTLNKVNTVGRGIYMYFANAPSSALFTNSNNKFYNINIQSTYNGYFLSGNATYPDQNNEIGTINGGVSMLTALGGGTSTCSVISLTNQNTVRVFNQAIINNSTTTGQINGILHTGTATTASIYNNLIRNLSTNTASTSTVYGMNFSSANKISVYGNTIDSIAATTGPAAGINASGTGSNILLNFYGNNIQRVFTSGTSALNSAFGFTNSGASVAINFYKNYISNIENKSASAAGFAAGVNISGTTCNVYNNFISDVKMAGGSTAAGARALSLVGGTSNFYVYHNSIYLDYTASAATVSGAALYLANLSGSFDIRNNIFVNNMNNSAGAKSVVVYAAGTGYLNKYATITDNNLYYAGTPSASNLVYFDGTNSDQTLTAYKNRIATRDQHSVTELPPFARLSSPYDLHLAAAVPTQCEKGGLPVLNPIFSSMDFDDEARSSTYPDLGADEGNFTRLDLTGPYINYTPLLRTTLFTARTLQAAIADPSGVPVSGPGLPVLYWKVNAAASFSAVPGTFTGGSSYTFTFGAGTAINDSVSYYIAAQDMAPAPNAIANPSAGAAGYSINVPAVAIPPVSPSYYKVLPSIGDFIYVGAGQAYTSLTGAAPGGVFAALKNAVVTKDVNIRITSDLTETGENDFTQWLEEGAGNYHITIGPNDAVPKTVTNGTLVNFNGIIRFNGVKRVTVDGSLAKSGSYLVFRGKEDYVPVFFFYNDASYDTITNVTIEGINSSNELGLIHFYGGLLTGNDSNTISNCILRDRSDAVGKPQNLVVSSVDNLSFPTIFNSGNSLLNNKMFNFNYNGFYSVGNNENWTISGNEIYDSTAGGLNVYGINLGSQGVNTVSGNDIHGLKFTSGSQAQVAGILIQNATNVTVAKNKIYNFPSNTGVLGGIVFFGSGGNAALVNAVNNQISIVPAGATDQYIVGIMDNASAGNTMNAYNNSIMVGGTSSSGTNSWAYLRQPVSGATNNTIRNNIFFNNRTGSTSSNFALGDEKFGLGQVTISNNLYLGSGLIQENFMDRSSSGTTGESFAAWVSATHDISSYGVIAPTVDPAVLFTGMSTGNLNINNSSDICWYVNGKALPLSNVAGDFGSSVNVRSVALATGSADIGSDEFNTTTLPPALTVTGTHAPGGIENFSFAGRTLGSITWGAGSSLLPTLGVIRHYTGEWPNDLTNNGTITDARTLNEWWDIPATGDGSFTYNISLAYDSAMQGKVLNEGTMIINKKQRNVAGTWALVSPTVIDTYNKKMAANGISTFAEFTGTDFDHNLPVTLLSFQAAGKQNDVILTWSTATEINNRFFELERSLDGHLFTKFAVFAGAGSSSSISRYSSVDTAALLNFKNAVNVYYRLKMIDVNGQVTYSQIAVVNPRKINATLVQAILPNPFADYIGVSLNLPDAGIITARIFDMGGKQIKTNTYRVNSGYSTIRIANLGNLSSGVYLVELRYKNEVITRKVVKK